MFAPRRRRDGPLPATDPGLSGPAAHSAVRLAAAAAVLGLVTGGKVLSPQLLLWAVPMLSLVLAGAGTASVAVAAAALTTAVYPHLSEELVRPGPRHLAVALVCGRNLLLIALYVAAVGVLVRGGSLLSLSSPSERSAAR